MEATHHHFSPVNNAIYETLGARWYDADDDPVALLRAEARFRNPWVLAKIAEALGPGTHRILDVGCGAGFLANYLALAGHRVIGVDAAPGSLRVARVHDYSRTVRYDVGDAGALPYADGAFDVVCAMDFLEHTPEPERAIAEAARVLAPSGLFLFHTFNRNLLSWLVVIKGVEWFVRNTPHDLHVFHLFLTPREVAAMCRAHGLEATEFVGSRPKIDAAFFRMLVTHRVPSEFQFRQTRAMLLGYSGTARKVPSRATP